MPRLLAVLVFSAAVVAQQPQTPAPPAAPPLPRGPLAADDVAALLKQFNVPGVSIAVVNDFAIEWARGYGVADVETGAPVTADTMFQAASISKPVAAMASMKAVAGRPLHARSGRQHHPEVVEAAGRRTHVSRSR